MQVETKQETDTTHLLPNKTSKALRWKWIVIVLVIMIIITITILMAIDVIPIFKNESNDTYSIGLYGKFPCYGGNAKNQQIIPSESNNKISMHNIKNVSLTCVYDSLNKTSPQFHSSVASSGYVVIDDEDKAYIADGSGFASCIDIATCQEIWAVNIAEILGYNANVTKLAMRHTTTLFKNSNGEKGIIFTAPNDRLIFSASTRGYNASEPCWALALSTMDGSLLWSTIIDYGITGYCCQSHGFMVDENDHYAYGGMSMSVCRERNQTYNNIYRGKMLKIDLDDGEIVNKWYSIDPVLFNYTMNDIDNPYIYRGGSFWNMPAIIEDYLVFGTANLWTCPKYIEECLLGNYSAFPIERANPLDPCNRNRSLDNRWWRCLEYGVYPDSFVILNKHTFELKSVTPLQGADVYGMQCGLRENIDPNCMKVQGPDADVSAVTTFKNPNDNKLYGAVLPKSGMLYIFEIPSGDIIIAKKIGPWSTSGGGQWSIGVDQKNMIAIATITGGTWGKSNVDSYKYRLMDGTVVCESTGSTHAIDLNTGNTIWQMINPWGTINHSNCSDPIYDEYNDYTLNATCQFDINGDPFIYPPLIDKNINVVIPIINKSEGIHFENNRYKSWLVAPITIVDDMVFIPSYSGYIFIHNIFNGSYIHSLICPQHGLIKGGVTVIEDRVVFHCGDNSAKVISMKVSKY